MRMFVLVVLTGAALGLMLPTSRHARPPAPGSAAAQVSVATPDPGPPMPVETKLERMPNGHFYADGSVNGQPVRLVVDTGASMVALTEEDAQRIGIAFNPAAFEVIGTGASGPVRGQDVTLDNVAVGGKQVAGVRGAVVEGLDVSLLGQSYLSRIGSVEMSGDAMILR
jgi:aspartyl protease family protein